MGKVIVTLANETSEEMEVAGPISLEIGDRKSYFECLVGPVLVEPLLGQVVLEVFWWLINYSGWRHANRSTETRP